MFVSCDTTLTSFHSQNIATLFFFHPPNCQIPNQHKYRIRTQHYNDSCHETHFVGKKRIQNNCFHLHTYPIFFRNLQERNIFLLGCNKYLKIQLDLMCKYGLWKFLDLQHKQRHAFLSVHKSEGDVD